MEIPLTGAAKKTHELFAFAGDRQKNLEHHARDVIDMVADAIRSEFGDKSFDIAFHLSDWNSDAAFIVALHLWPEQFTPEEILDGVYRFVLHAPNHTAAAAALAGFSVTDAFKLGFTIPPKDD
ncbi:MAG: hypothetical protein JSS65_04710 [Armatimonadetes bacterium]|nr:hypothetical protein [Armatimonadota bacterium]